MIERAFLSVSPDVSRLLVGLTLLLCLSSIGLLVAEQRGRGKRALTLLTGVLATVALGIAVLRPVRVVAKESSVGPRVVVLVDQSRSMLLPDRGTARSARRDEAVKALVGSLKGARISMYAFGDAPPRPFEPGDAPVDSRSDLSMAMRKVLLELDERPSSVVVVTDGRLDQPTAADASLRELAEAVGVPIHTVLVGGSEPKDASVRSVSLAGAAIAHVPLPVRVTVACSGGLRCGDVPVTARELREDGAHAVLATGIAKLQGGEATLDLFVTFDRTGHRVLEVSVGAQPDDEVPGNDRRLLSLHVARERIRILHVAGRPTNDTRALRQWLKADASIDVVAFFILRTPQDNTNTASQDELALIPFPVDELFSQHLASFDAVVLQDFDAQPYGLEKHLPALARYVRGGGGLIMVGGPNAFVGGGYTGTPLGEVLPVELDASGQAPAADLAAFEPAWTETGLSAPLLRPLRDAIGSELPAMPGANVLGDAKKDSLVLWSHPTRKTRRGAPMPVLAVADVDNGRSIAFGIDGAWRLGFSELAARTAGRGYAALWEGLVGWLMHDLRYEPSQIELEGTCVAGVAPRIVVRAAHGISPAAELEIRRTDRPGTASVTTRLSPADRGTYRAEVPALAAGAYTVRAKSATGLLTRRDIACEEGGAEWADSRPDPTRLRALSAIAGGAFFDTTRRLELAGGETSTVSMERHVTPLLPAWAWSLAAASLLGIHWISRRRAGLV